MENKSSTNQPLSKKLWFNLALLVFAGALVFIGCKIGAQSNANKVENEDTSTIESEAKAPATPAQNVNPDTDIRRVIMVDTVSKWDDVDEFSLHIDENTEKNYTGDRVVNITANYNGISSNLEDALVSYCNKIATAIDLTGHSVAELDIVWTVPAESATPLGECHYHSNDGVLVYDDESNGILTNK